MVSLWCFFVRCFLGQVFLGAFRLRFAEPAVRRASIFVGVRRLSFRELAAEGGARCGRPNFVILGFGLGSMVLRALAARNGILAVDSWRRTRIKPRFARYLFEDGANESVKLSRIIPSRVSPKRVRPLRP